MMKYPIGVQSFEQIIQDGYVYVDKTAMIYDLVKKGKIYFLSRPRRFGKSLLMSTLENYFLGRKELFRGLAIDTLEKEWLEYPVFHIDFNGGNFKEAGILEGILEDTVSAWERNYPPTDRYTGVGRRFQEVLRTAHERTGRRCVVLIDEYDKPLLDVLETGLTTVIDGQERLLEDWHKDVLRGFYSVFKAADADLQFVLLTGVTKFAQVSVFSGFNQPKDISMDSRYDTLCGITQQELESCFAEPIKDLAAKYGVSVPEITDSLKRRYDGYHFSEEMTDVYNPFSLLNVFDSLKMRDYWMTTGTSDYLVRLLSRSDENMEEMLMGEYTPSAFADYKAMPLPMIYQSGYLTIKGYDRETELFRLDFPNEEVRRGFLSMLASGYISKSDARMESWAANVRNALSKGNIDGLREYMESLLSDIPYGIRCSRTDGEARERDFQYTFYLIFRMLGGWKVYAEKSSGQGRADCVVETDRFVYIFEFKLDGTAEDALRQIEEKGYARPYTADTRRRQYRGLADRINCISLRTEISRNDKSTVFRHRRDTGKFQDAFGSEADRRGSCRSQKAWSEDIYLHRQTEAADQQP